jgi:uncharacterized protein
MRLQAHADVRAFLAAAEPVLGADEPRHNLIYGISSTLLDAPDAYADKFFWTVEDGGVVGAALMTPPFNLVLARPLAAAVAAFAVRALREQGVELPGVTGALPESDEFARAWRELTGARLRVRMSQGIYAARAAHMPAGVPGTAREAERHDRDLVLAWMRAFQQEALEEEAALGNLEQIVDRRLASSNAGIVLWEDAGDRVSLCGYGGRTPHGIRIGPVYTPPELRRRGYASALTAHVTKALLDSGRDYCFLYTDLTNPTSNRIYTNIGYERVCDSAEYVFGF